MTVSLFEDHIQAGTHAARPAATAVASGALYSCSDHSLIYQSDGATWSTYATLGQTGAVLQSLADAKGDLLAASAADTVTRLAVGTNGQVLTADSAEATGVKWAAASGGGSGTSVAKVKSADQSVTGITGVDETGDLTVTVGVSETWVIDYVLGVSCASNTPDIKVGAVGTGTVTGYQNWDTWILAETDNEGDARRQWNSVLGALAAAGVTTTPAPLRIRAVAVGGASGGTIKIQFCQNSNDGANAVKLLAGSSLMAVKA